MPSDETIAPDEHTTDVVGARVGAQLVDLVLMSVQTFVVLFALAALARPESESAFRGLAFVGFLTLPLYGGLLEGYWHGQTVGKRLLNVRVVDHRGRDPSVGQALLRNVPAIVLFSWLTTAVALLAIAMDDRNQRLFDQAADTYVVDCQ